MRILGAILLTASASLIGILKAKSLKESAASLAELISFLQMMKCEIATSVMPVKLIIKRGLESECRYISCFLNELEQGLDSLHDTSFDKMWKNSVTSALTFLSDRQCFLLCSLGESIGRFEPELQGEAIDGCITVFEKDLAEINSQLKSNQKMYIGLGSGAGLILSIILI